MSSTLIDSNDSAVAAAGSESSGLMAEFSIVHVGRYYHYGGYRYERLADAIAYAQLMRARQTERADSSAFEKIDTVESPSAADRQLMIELSICFENGSFVFEGYRYDHLIDAANYARHRQQFSLKTL